KWLSDLKRAGKSVETIHTYSWVIKIFVNDLIDQGVLRADGFKKFEVPEHAAMGRKSWLPLDVANRVIAEAKDPELKFILFCGFHAGLRKSEILAAKVGWFDLTQDPGLLHVQNDPASGFILKDRENRVIPLTDEFKKFLMGFLSERDPD